MTVGKAIYYLLNNSTDLEAVVGTRIFPEVAEQDSALPFVMYSVISNEPSDTHSGPSLLDVAQVDVIAYNTSYSGCIDMGEYVREALDRVTGTYNGVNVQSCQYNSEVIDFDEYKRAYVITQSYDVRINRLDVTIPSGEPVTVTDGDGSLHEVEAGGSYTCLPATPKSGILYQRPGIGGALTSRQDGDHYWQLQNGLLPYPAHPSNPLTYATPAVDNSYDTSFMSFALLQNDNVFGNKYRWTNTAGKQGNSQAAGYSAPQFHYTNDWDGALHGYVIDHLTGLAWTAYAQNPPNGVRITSTVTHGGVVYTRELYTWQSCANYSQGLNGEEQFTMGGYRDWRLPTLHEAQTFLSGFDGIQFGYVWTGVSAQFGDESLNYWYNVLGQVGNPPRAASPSMWTSNLWSSTIAHSLNNYECRVYGITSHFPCILVRNHF